ncbi:MAG: LLM class F420-dependent oxidoreductase [Pseudomonadales bacterium]
MEFGIGMFTTAHSAGPAEVAREVEARGFGSFWVSEHSHIPVAAPPPFEGFDPKHYASMLDPFVSLTAAAMVTDRIKLGMAICLVIQRDPINCAKAVASLDHLANGRFLFGIGAGWNEEEMSNHGTDPSSRFRLMRERVEAMKLLWTEEMPEYHGRLVDFDPVYQWPKPSRSPHPPILVAGAGPGILKRVVRYGDGWLPVVVPEIAPGLEGRVTPMAEFVEMVPRLNAMAAEAGRAKPEISVSGATPDPQAYEVYESLAVERMILRVEPADLDSVKRTLDSYVEQVEAIGGRLAA